MVLKVGRVILWDGDEDDDGDGDERGNWGRGRLVLYGLGLEVVVFML
jgi:hypothetical protein